jgi:hypothetical protein
LPSDRAAREASPAQLVRLQPDDGPGAGGDPEARAQAGPIPRYPVPRRLQPGRQDDLYRPAHAEGVQVQGQEIETDRFLLLHEEVEKTLIDHLGLHYLHAHQIALRSEQAAVRAAGIEWRDYDRFMQKYVKKFGDERLTKVPTDLDTKPYRDEHDTDLLKRMTKCTQQELPKGVDAPKLQEKIKKTLATMHHHEHAR